MASIPRFNRAQLDQARGLTRLAAESVVASALDLPVSQLRQWRMDGIGPDYHTTVNGQTIYRKTEIIMFIRSHLNR